MEKMHINHPLTQPPVQQALLIPINLLFAFSCLSPALNLKPISGVDIESIAAEKHFAGICSGFPEPFFKANKTFYKRWRRTHMDIILRQDLLDLYAISDIKAIEDLVLLLKDRVGSSVSYANLAGDLQRDASTVKRWLTMLENLYIIFRVTPYHKKISRSLLKEPKFYFYDHAYAEKNPGAHLENIVACALLKELDFITDTTGVGTKLHYLRTKDGKEIDFLICQDDAPSHMIEIKSSDITPSAAFDHFTKFLPQTKKLQLVKSAKRTQSYPSGVQVHPLIDWLQHMDIL